MLNEKKNATPAGPLASLIRRLMKFLEVPDSSLKYPRHSFDTTMTAPHRLLASLTGISLLLCSCAVSTPQTRIERNPGAFESLSARQQGLVERGLIEKGMPKKGVILALGNPAGRANGYRNGKDFERWTYARLRPHYRQNFYGSYGGCRGHRRYRGYGIGFAPSIEYYPTRSATVWFHRDKVDFWERVGPTL
mgnify:FL=1